MVIEVEGCRKAITRGDFTPWWIDINKLAVVRIQISRTIMIVIARWRYIYIYTSRSIDRYRSIWSVRIFVHNPTFESPTGYRLCSPIKIVQYIGRAINLWDGVLGIPERLHNLWKSSSNISIGSLCCAVKKNLRPVVCHRIFNYGTLSRKINLGLSLREIWLFIRIHGRGRENYMDHCMQSRRVTKILPRSLTWFQPILC